MITINKKGLDRRLNKLINNNTDFRKGLREAAEIIMVEADSNFAKQGRLYNNWAPLRPSTIEQRGSARPILERTGKLRRGFRMKDLKRTSVKVNNPVSYGRYHQHGTRKMAQRIILSATDKSASAIAEILVKRIFK